ncbi:MAG TPA: hypothetical protein VKB65_02040 [Myxococcota bacterium]|nr:hypothetical protein [Myxococcota bacterium]
MATRPFAFGARFVEKGRTVRIQADPLGTGRYTVEASCGGSSRRTEHASLTDAVRHFAATWRARLH